MSHWAEIDSDNTVLRVLVGNNDELDEGYSTIVNALGGIWVKTSYNTLDGTHLQGGEPFRGTYAGIGMKYDPIKDIFYKPEGWGTKKQDVSLSNCLGDSPIPGVCTCIDGIWIC